MLFDRSPPAARCENSIKMGFRELGCEVRRCIEGTGGNQVLMQSAQNNVKRTSCSRSATTPFQVYACVIRYHDRTFRIGFEGINDYENVVRFGDIASAPSKVKIGQLVEM
jgi:hypothetical protein